MDGTEANVSVSGPGANTIAENLLSAAGIKTGHVGEADIEVVVGPDGDSTVLNIECGGSDAGKLLRQSLGNIDWSEYDVQSVSAEVAHNDSPQTESEPDKDDGDGDDDHGEESDVANQVTPFADQINPAVVEYPATQPGRLRPGTLQHLVAELLLDAREVLDDEWFSANEIDDFGGDQIKLRQCQNQLSKLFVTKGLIARRPEEGSGTKSYEYNPTRELAQEVRRVGDYEDATEE